MQSLSPPELLIVYYRVQKNVFHFQDLRAGFELLTGLGLDSRSDD